MDLMIEYMALDELKPYAAPRGTGAADALRDEAGKKVRRT